MNYRAVEVGLLATLVAGLGIGVRVVAGPIVHVSVPEASGVTERRQPAVAAWSVDSLGALAVARAPFRVTRRPAAVAYDPLRVDQPAAPPAPKPVLVLVGLVAGPEPSAVVEGFPGIEGARVVRVGDVVSGLRVQRITDDGVRITGLDTTWVLKVREPWK